ncbi:hypothetical protein JD844_032123, partial [Phrynosoma platyrhinos]
QCIQSRGGIYEDDENEEDDGSSSSTCISDNIPDNEGPCTSGSVAFDGEVDKDEDVAANYESVDWQRRRNHDDDDMIAFSYAQEVVGVP